MFTIYRDPNSVRELRAAWDRADEPGQAAILTALQGMDRELMDAPLEAGEGRGGGARVLIRAPLATTFEVDLERRNVRVLRVWAFAVKSPRPDPAE